MEQDKSNTTKEGLSIISAAAFLVLSEIGVAVLSLPIVLILNETGIRNSEIGSAYTSMMLDIISNALLILIMYSLTKERRGGKLKLKGYINKKYILLTVIFIIGFYLFMRNSLGLILNKIPLPEAIQKDFEIFAKSNFVLITVMIIIAPIAEEIVFRGIILDGFLKRYNCVIALIVSSALFGVLHANLPQGINAFVLGLVLGFIYLKTQSLFLCMLGHFTNNFIAIISGITGWNTGKQFNLIYLIIGIVALVFVIKKLINESKKNGIDASKSSNFPG